MLLAAARQPRMVSVVSNYTMSNSMSFAPFFENIDCCKMSKTTFFVTNVYLTNNLLTLMIRSLSFNNWLMLILIIFRYIFAGQMLITCPNCNIVMDLTHTKVDNNKIFYILSYLTFILRLRSIA